MIENSNRKRSAGAGRGRQKKHCTNEGFGQGRDRNCNYRGTVGPAEERPQSLVAAVFDSLDKIIERSKKTVALLSSQKEPDRRIGSNAEKPLLTDEAAAASGDKVENTVKQIADGK